MLKTAEVEAVSYKTQSILIANKWIPIMKGIDLRTIEVGKVHKFDAVKDFDNNWIIKQVLDPVVYTKGGGKHE